MSIVLVGSTSGSVTLQEPAVAGTTVLTLPAVSGTVITTGTTGQVIDSGALPIGSVLQVVNGTKTGQLEASFSSATDLGLSATITPKFATSKILVLVNCGSCTIRTGSTFWHMNLLRGSTSLIYFADYIGINSTGTVTSPNTSYLDSPATTSATTYKIQGLRASGSNDCIFNYSDGTYPSVSTMTLMEIAQ
jgi:hypothetical protein